MSDTTEEEVYPAGTEWIVDVLKGEGPAGVQVRVEGTTESEARAAAVKATPRGYKVTDAIRLATADDDLIATEEIEADENS